MTYVTRPNVIKYLDISGTEDNEFIDFMILKARQAVDTYCDRTFAPASTVDPELRNFTVGVDTRGRYLFFSEDICQIVEVLNDADNPAGGTEVLPAEYITYPRNRTPFTYIRILRSAHKYWQYTTDPEMGITVSGFWAYSMTPPEDVIMACLRWCGHMYRSKDSQIFDTIAMPEAGILTVPQGMPADCKILLDPYRNKRPV